MPISPHISQRIWSFCFFFLSLFLFCPCTYFSDRALVCSQGWPHNPALTAQCPIYWHIWSYLLKVFNGISNYPCNQTLRQSWSVCVKGRIACISTSKAPVTFCVSMYSDHLLWACKWELSLSSCLIVCLSKSAHTFKSNNTIDCKLKPTSSLSSLLSHTPLHWRAISRNHSLQFPVLLQFFLSLSYLQGPCCVLLPCMFSVQ